MTKTYIVNYSPELTTWIIWATTFYYTHQLCSFFNKGIIQLMSWKYITTKSSVLVYYVYHLKCYHYIWLPYNGYSYSNKCTVRQPCLPHFCMYYDRCVGVTVQNHAWAVTHLHFRPTNSLVNWLFQAQQIKQHGLCHFFLQSHLTSGFSA